MQLSQKELELLKDLKGQEKLCVEKYSKHASCARDSQLKGLFEHIAGIEQQHFDTLTQIENGTVPSTNSGSGSQASLPSFTGVYGIADNADKQNDCFLCTDLLTTEKHASHLYDTCIFEFKDENLRSALNHIQKEEQQHGKMIYDYMQANGMYS